ncbi:MAG: GntR family transcriptional regulator [Betaproteobacteria bacterium]|nr:GntR family transcriptional regulator [Betaproteobacteria bacterium]
MANLKAVPAVRAMRTRRRKPRAPLSDAVYQSIKQDIYDYRLLPGGRFTEGEVAARLRVSRTPVRDALKRLDKEGYLRVHFRSGWSVRELDFTQFDQLYDLRVILEVAAVRILCEALLRPDLGALKKLWLVPPEERSMDAAIVFAADEAFHSSLVAAAGNPELSRCHQDVTDRIRVLRRLDFTEPARIVLTYQEHAQILRAIVRRQTDHALLLLRAHIEMSKSEVRKISLHKLYAARNRA